MRCRTVTLSAGIRRSGRKCITILKKSTDFMNFLQNSKDQIDLFTEADRLEQEYADVYKDPLLGEYLVAEVAVCRIIQQINKELLGCLNFEAILYEE